MGYRAVAALQLRGARLCGAKPAQLRHRVEHDRVGTIVLPRDLLAHVRAHMYEPRYETYV